MNWKERIYGSLTEDATKKARTKLGKAHKKAKTKRVRKAADPHKAGEHLGKHAKTSFHAIMDPDNDQYLNRKGTKDE